jgi:hypothetical protein
VDDGYNNGLTILEQFFGAAKHRQEGYLPGTGPVTVTTRKFLVKVEIALPLNNDVSVEMLQQKVNAFENVCTELGRKIKDAKDDLGRIKFKLTAPLKAPNVDCYSMTNWGTISELVNSTNLIGVRQMQTFMRSWNNIPLGFSQAYESMRILSTECEGDQGLFWLTAYRMRMPDTVANESKNMMEVYDFIMKVMHYEVSMRMKDAVLEDPNNDIVSDKPSWEDVLDTIFSRTGGAAKKQGMVAEKPSMVSEDEVKKAIILVKRLRSESKAAWMLANRMGFTSIFMLPPKSPSR